MRKIPLSKTPGLSDPEDIEKTFSSKNLYEKKFINQKFVVPRHQSTKRSLSRNFEQKS